MKNKLLVLFISLFAIVALVACAGDDADDTPTNNVAQDSSDDTIENIEDEVAEYPTDDVTIRVAMPWSDEIFESRFGKIEEKHPHITIEQVPFNGSREVLEELFANNVEFDIILSTNIQMMDEYELIYPLDEMVETYGFDLDELHPGIINYLRSIDTNNRLVGFPDGTAYQALFYNKDVFDLFGVPYPDPDVPMTWQETFELAEQMTGTRDGEEYTGLTFNPQTQTRAIPLRQLGINATDPETGEVLITEEEGFHRYLSLMEDFINIPGMPSDALQSYQFAYKRVGMSLGYHIYLGQDWGDKEYKKDMDLVPLPVWEDHPNASPALSTTPMIISNYSDNKEVAFQVLTEYVSKENQMEISENMGSGVVLTDPEVIAAFGSNVPGYDGKNIDAFFKHTPVEMENRSQWDSYVNMYDAEGALDMLVEGTDVNTILREISEQAETAIQEAQADQ